MSHLRRLAAPLRRAWGLGELALLGLVLGSLTLTPESRYLARSRQEVCSPEAFRSKKDLGAFPQKGCHSPSRDMYIQYTIYTPSKNITE